MTNFLIDFLSKNQNKINKQAVDTTRIFNELGGDKQNIPAALGEAFSQRVPTTLFKESFYAAYKQFSEYKESIEEQYQGQPIQREKLINIELTNVLKEHAPELFNLYYLTLASTYADIYNSTNFTENDQVIPSEFSKLLTSEFSELLTKDTGKIIFSIAANISTITDKLFPILSENTGNLIDEDGTLSAHLTGSIINYIGQLGNRLQNINDVRDFLKVHQTPERMLELQLFELEREVKWGKLSEETDQIKQKYNTFIKLATEFSESSTVLSDVLLDQVNQLKKETTNQSADKLKSIDNALEKLSNLGIQYVEVIELREKLEKDKKAQEKQNNSSSSTPKTQKNSSSWFKEKMYSAKTLTNVGLFSQISRKNHGGNAPSQENSPQSPRV